MSRTVSKLVRIITSSSDASSSCSKLHTPIFALVIGINRYPGFPSESQLKGAVPDADAVIRYLKDTFTKPNITYLRDAAATRKGIINAFRSLRDNTNIQRDDAIFIYYAGHGARVQKPPEWDRWVSHESQIELLCPSDMHHGQEESPICGIPDRTVAVLLNEISEKHGDNIVSCAIMSNSNYYISIQTFILDCCHSGGANRQFNDLTARVIANPPPVPATCDDTIWSNTAPARSASASINFLGQNSESHVLLAGCRRDELSWETEDGHGLFTRALLEVLTGISPNSLDYATLVRKLEDLSKSASDSIFLSIAN
jgi:hypothetical protein